MTRYVNWVKSLDGKPVFVAYPAGFDFLFVYWYLIKFVGDSPFSHSALDIKSFAMVVLKSDFRQSTKRNMPKRWFDQLPHSHVALGDAIEQGMWEGTRPRLFLTQIDPCWQRLWPGNVNGSEVWHL